MSFIMLTLLVISIMTDLLFLEDVGDHDYVFISFDLYIRGSWDGNLFLPQ